MLTLFERAAVFLRPFQRRLLLAVVLAVAASVCASVFPGGGIGGTVGGLAMMLAWWLWLLFLIPRCFDPKHRDLAEKAMFPRFDALLRGWFVLFFIVGFVAPVIVPVVFVLID